MKLYWEYHDGLIYLVKRRDYKHSTRFEYEVMCPHCEKLHNVFPYEARAWFTDHVESCPSRPRDGDPDEVDQWAVRRFLSHTFGFRRTRVLSDEVIARQKDALARRRAGSSLELERVAGELRIKNPNVHELAPQRVQDGLVVQANSCARRLHSIDAATERIKEQTYGICQECQVDIWIERLEALPEAILCERCARRFELRTRT